MYDIRSDLDAAFAALSALQGQKALELYEKIIARAPGEPAAYIGKANALLLANDHVQYADLYAPVLKAATLECSEEYEKDFRDLLNFQTPPNDLTLLHHACTYKHYDVVKALVDMGANIHIMGKGGMTPLWFLAFKPIAQNQRSDCIKIAKLLLGRGAEINVTNANGVALYNVNTDPAIAKIIRSYYPDAVMGAAGKLSDSDPKPSAPINMGAVLGVSALVVGIVLAAIFKITIIGGGIITLVMCVGGFLIGALIDENRKDGGNVGQIIKLLFIYVMILIAGIFLFNACGNGLVRGSSSGSSSYSSVTCPRCGTGYRSNHPAGEYVRKNGVCSRCS